LRFGYTAGLFAELFKLQKFSTVVEINFEQKGGNDKQIHPVVESHYSTLLVLSVPVLAKFTFPSNSHVLPYISLGPRADFLLSKEEGWEVNVYKNINPVNFGMSVSTGAEIPLSKKASILLEAVYSPDLTTYSYQTFLSRNYDVRNTSFEIKTGLLFNR
jgi:hypothetical protein